MDFSDWVGGDFADEMMEFIFPGKSCCAFNAMLVVGMMCLLTTSVTSTIKLPYTIQGPKNLNDRIAVVGAGPGGIHMALLLKEKGFTNVQVLEKTDQIGGKSISVEYRGAVHEMGTVYLSKDYQMIKDLVKKYVPGDITPFPPATVWLDNIKTPVNFDLYVTAFIAKSKGLDQPMAILREVLGKLGRYQILHKQIFGDYTGEIMPEPKKEVCCCVVLLVVRAIYLHAHTRKRNM